MLTSYQISFGSLKIWRIIRRYLSLSASSPFASGQGDGVASQKSKTLSEALVFQPGSVMSTIQSIGTNSPVPKIVQQPIPKQIPADPAPQSPTVDKLELSGMSHLLKVLKSNDVRVDKVAQVRAQIDAGTYETDDKLNVAADRLLDDLMK